MISQPLILEYFVTKKFSTLPPYNVQNAFSKYSPSHRLWSCGSLVRSVTSYGLDNPGIQILVGTKDFSFLCNIQTGCAVRTNHLPIQWVLEVNHGRCEADHSPPYGGDIKNERSCTSAPPICLKSCVQKTFTFYCTNCELPLRPYTSSCVVYFTKVPLRMSVFSDIFCFIECCQKKGT